MELVAILRLLWRHRLLVFLAGLVAVLVGLSMSARIGFPPKLESRHYEVGVGAATALVDTPQSQVADLGPDTGSDIATLSSRASLLASLMTSSPLKDQIAARAGIASDDLVTAAPDATTGATGGVVLKGDDQTAHVLKAGIANLESGQIPIISVSTQAPSAAAAARLADASIAVLQEHILSTAGVDKVPEGRRVVVRGLGPARATTVSRGPSPIIGLLIAVVIFLVGCGAIVGVSALVRGWRRAAELERVAAEQHRLQEDEESQEPEPGSTSATRLAAVDHPVPSASAHEEHEERDDDDGDDDATRVEIMTWPGRRS